MAQDFATPRRVSASLGENLGENLGESRHRPPRRGGGPRLGSRGRPRRQADARHPLLRPTRTDFINVLLPCPERNLSRVGNAGTPPPVASAPPVYVGSTAQHCTARGSAAGWPIASGAASALVVVLASSPIGRRSMPRGGACILSLPLLPASHERVTLSRSIRHRSQRHACNHLRVSPSSRSPFPHCGPTANATAFTARPPAYFPYLPYLLYLVKVPGNHFPQLSTADERRSA